MSQASFADESGIVRLKGTLTGGAPKPAPVLDNYQASAAEGNATTLANGDIGVLSWGALVQGTGVLDLTDPLNPTVVTEGTYSFALSIAPSTSTMTAGGRIGADLILDAGGPIGPAITGSVYAPDGAIPLSMTLSLPAGARCAIVGLNNDGAQAITFQVSAYVQKIS